MFQKMLQSGGGASSFQFSTEEQKTNLKWFGKDVYCKGFDILSSSSSVVVLTVSSLGADSVLDVYGIIKRSGTQRNEIGITHTDKDGLNYASSWVRYDDTITISCGSAISPIEYIGVIFYTKS